MLKSKRVACVEMSPRKVRDSSAGRMGQCNDCDWRNGRDQASAVQEAIDNRQAVPGVGLAIRGKNDADMLVSRPALNRTVRTNRMIRTVWSRTTLTTCRKSRNHRREMTYAIL